MQLVIGDVQLVVEDVVVPPVGVKVGGEVGVTHMSPPQVDHTPEVVAQLVV